ncbi:hypothetical protein WJX72_000735 [[Myrmecia] bisecta]|uniref:MORN repeat-containing protein 5 n=1 Tax=[Myrmecia] bisecta TaxID=41462 RepID=A0AAW1P4A7_9CHLO
MAAFGDEDQGNFPPEPKDVGRGLDAANHNFRDPQEYLANSNHPYAPFTGNALKWESYVFDDATTYEGLMKSNTPHGKGVLVFGNGLGGGIQHADRGDKYEGEFYSGFAHGLGMYTAHNGEIYRGEWLLGKRHGCGAQVNLEPFYNRVEQGMEPRAAWAASKEEVERKAAYGQWQSDFFLAPPDESGRYCHINEIKGVLQEMDSVVTRARMFKFKPDGEVTIRMAQDAVGLPAPLMQDPIHYPHGTKFLAPGPMGQVHPIPEDDNLKAEMLKHARNYERIYNMYNFDAVTLPGSDMEKAERVWRRELARRRARKQRQADLERRRLQRLERRRKKDMPAAAQEAERQRQLEELDEGGGDFNEDDLVASVSGLDLADDVADGAGASRAGEPSTAQRSMPRPTVFASVSLGMDRAAVAAFNALQDAARHVPRRRCLTRPTRR